MLGVVFFLLGDLSADEFYVLTFRNTLATPLDRSCERNAIEHSDNDGSLISNTMLPSLLT